MEMEDFKFWQPGSIEEEISYRCREAARKSVGFDQSFRGIRAVSLRLYHFLTRWSGKDHWKLA
jgi:hypothetical protein